MWTGPTPDAGVPAALARHGFCCVRLREETQEAVQQLHTAALLFFRDTPLAAKLRCKVSPSPRRSIEMNHSLPEINMPTPGKCARLLGPAKVFAAAPRVDALRRGAIWWTRGMGLCQVVLDSEHGGKALHGFNQPSPAKELFRVCG
jgi:hypothetical protein